MRRGVAAEGKPPPYSFSRYWSMARMSPRLTSSSVPGTWAPAVAALRSPANLTVRWGPLYFYPSPGRSEFALDSAP